MCTPSWSGNHVWLPPLVAIHWVAPKPNVRCTRARNCVQLLKLGKCILKPSINTGFGEAHPTLSLPSPLRACFTPARVKAVFRLIGEVDLCPVFLLPFTCWKVPLSTLVVPSFAWQLSDSPSCTSSILRRLSWSPLAIVRLLKMSFV